MSPVLVNRSSLRMPRARLLVWVKKVKRELKRCDASLNFDLSDLTIVFVNVREAKALNRQFRRRNYATDILSFGSFAGGFAELVICPQVVSKQAVEHQMTFINELEYMVLHGVLHLLGFDHEKGGPAAQEMLALQDKIFERLCR